MCLAASDFPRLVPAVYGSIFTAVTPKHCQYNCVFGNGSMESQISLGFRNLLRKVHVRTMIRWASHSVLLWPLQHSVPYYDLRARYPSDTSIWLHTTACHTLRCHTQVATIVPGQEHQCHTHTSFTCILISTSLSFTIVCQNDAYKP